jgi:uncharacterized protein
MSSRIFQTENANGTDNRKFLMDILFSDALKLQGPSAFSIMAKPSGPLCNLNCTYCYYLEKKKLYPSVKDFRMQDDVLENFIRQYIEAVQLPSVTFVWQGGEPTLLGLEYFRKIVALQKKYSGNKKIENSFQTNGTLLDADWCSFFADNHFLVGISIDGEEHNHDHFRESASGAPTFKKVMKGIELLHQNKVEFNTLSCVNSYNVRFPSETYRFLRQIGSGFIQFIPVIERFSVSAVEHELRLISPDFPGDAEVTSWSVPSRGYGEFLSSIFDIWVRADVARVFVQIFDATLANYAGEMPGLCVFTETCGDALAMEHNGDLYSCDHYVYQENRLGNISETDLKEMVGSQAQFRFGLSKRNTLPVVCRKCDVRFACHGECPKHRFMKTPDGNSGLNYLCEGYKLFFHHVHPYMEYMTKELKSERAPANVMNWIRIKEKQAVKMVLPERNALCPCGSGKKFKNCCALKLST